MEKQVNKRSRRNKFKLSAVLLTAAAIATTPLLLALWLQTSAQAATKSTRYKSTAWHPATVERVVDGDTFAMQIHIGWEIILQTHVRLFNFDTPEIRGEQKARGLEARTFVVGWFAACGPNVVVLQHGREKYGRWLVDVRCETTNKDLGAVLLEVGHAK